LDGEEECAVEADDAEEVGEGVHSGCDSVTSGSMLPILRRAA
jgi:hypothetical protein